MEHRLCHREQGLEIPMMNAADALESSKESHEAAILETEKKLEEMKVRHLIQEIDDGLIALRKDPEAFRELVRMRITGLKERSQEAAQTFSTDLQATETALQQLLKGTDKTTVRDIIKSLQRPLPAKDKGTHRYGTQDGVNFKQIEADQELIRKSIMPSYPQAAKPLAHVDNALTYLARQDIRYNIRQLELKKKDNKFDALVGGTLKGAGVIALAAAGLLTGVAGIASMVKEKKLSAGAIAGPLLYLGAAGFIASSEFRQLFSTSDQVKLTEIDATLNNDAFHALSQDYNMQGDAWARFIRKTLRKKDDANAFLNTLKTKKGTKDVEKEIDRFVTRASPDAAVQANLRRMVDDGRFPDLMYILGFAKSEDAQNVIFDYVRLGSDKYHTNAKAVARQLDQKMP